MHTAKYCSKIARSDSLHILLGMLRKIVGGITIPPKVSSCLVQPLPDSQGCGEIHVQIRSSLVEWPRGHGQGTIDRPGFGQVGPERRHLVRQRSFRLCKGVLDVVAKHQEKLTAMKITVHVVKGDIRQRGVETIKIHRDAKATDDTGHMSCWRNKKNNHGPGALYALCSI